MEITGANTRTKWTRDPVHVLTYPSVVETANASCSTADDAEFKRSRGKEEMDREELKAKIDELMRQYDDGEIDGDAHSKAMMELTASAQD